MNVSAGLFGSSGGSNSTFINDEFERVRVCNSGQTGEICQNITFKKRQKSNAIVVVDCTVTQGGSELIAPCPNNYGIPNWLKKLNSFFDNAPAPNKNTNEMYVY